MCAISSWVHGVHQSLWGSLRPFKPSVSLIGSKCKICVLLKIELAWPRRNLGPPSGGIYTSSGSNPFRLSFLGFRNSALWIWTLMARISGALSSGSNQSGCDSVALFLQAQSSFSSPRLHGISIRGYTLPFWETPLEIFQNTMVVPGRWMNQRFELSRHRLLGGNVH